MDWFDGRGTVWVQIEYDSFQFIFPPDCGMNNGRRFSRGNLPLDTQTNREILKRHIALR